ncbi:GIY-YIG nuclease family protein [Robertkochia aurantiaca]|uniref:GIY-YIG nuclease family protein n=1 Tax=Robertkochia aurantiaca TaxID=2873700 RepID=UPI001CCF3231|nr:GIY-YIG nuclease family protein [Robertkochia sp. 3YJGBD-33]
MHLYIIYSEKVDRFYFGITVDLDERLIKHNSHAYAQSFTKIAQDWKFVLTYQCPDPERAKYLEGFIKRMKSRTFIRKILSDPNILDEL